MDLWIILTTLARRWYLSLPLVIASVFGAFMLANALANSYTATASVLIAAPNERLIEVPVDPADPTNFETIIEVIDVNPLTDGIGNVGLAAATLQLTLVDDRTVDQMAELGLSDDYLVETLDRNSAILAIEANGNSPEQAIDTVGYLIARIDADLDDLQDSLGAPQTARIDDEVLTRPTEAFITSSGKPRIILGVTMAGLVLTVLLVSAVDSMLRARDPEAAEAELGRSSSRRAIEAVGGDDDGDQPSRTARSRSSRRAESRRSPERDADADRWQRAGSK